MNAYLRRLWPRIRVFAIIMLLLGFAKLGADFAVGKLDGASTADVLTRVLKIVAAALVVSLVVAAASDRLQTLESNKR